MSRVGQVWEFRDDVDGAVETHLVLRPHSKHSGFTDRWTVFYFERGEVCYLHESTFINGENGNAPRWRRLA